MKIVVILTFLYFKSPIRCQYVDSYIRSDPEFSPTYDTIIFRDMVDIMNELDNDMNSGIDLNFYYENDGDDNIEDLLAEYHRFLDRAQKQRVIVEKSKLSNKLPIHNRDNHVNNRLYDQPYPDILKYSLNSVPLSSEMFSHFKNKFLNDLNKKSTKITSPYEIPTSCYCQDNKFPCKCGCKQCIVPFKPVAKFQYTNSFNSPNVYDSKTIHNQRYSEEGMDDSTKEKLGVNIKVDVKLPKSFETFMNILYKIMQNSGRPDELLARDTMNVPFSYMNNQFPNIFSLRPHIYKHLFEPNKKRSFYINKKNRTNKSGKRHKKRKMGTIHNVSFEGFSEKNYTQENGTNINCSSNSTNNINCTYKQGNISSELVQNLKNNSNVSIPLNTTQTNFDTIDNNTESIYLLFNISSTVTDNLTEDYQKSENSIEQFEKAKTESSNIRQRRDIMQVKNNTIKYNNTVKTNAVKIKTINKISTIDDELLYWPTSVCNNSVEISKNITSLILERERKKVKLNITNDMMRNNHTMALERAVFGEINWDDMNAVVPVFISFVGKYLKGILTFCSENMCHSMKCAEKSCLYRVCKPQERFNVKGHCMGRNNTDSIAALESIMDLPSSIALEIVDILEDKLRGKMFGKATLCINLKCITFVTSKKSFIKSKCTFKQLSVTGHCPNIKIM